MNLVTLLDGRQVDSASEEWRHLCEARWVAERRSTIDRRQYLEAVEASRGKPAADRLRATLAELWKERQCS